MQPHEIARTKIINDLNLMLTLQEIKQLEMILSWLFNKGIVKATARIEKG